MLPYRYSYLLCSSSSEGDVSLVFMGVRRNGEGSWLVCLLLLPLGGSVCQKVYLALYSEGSKIWNPSSGTEFQLKAIIKNTIFPFLERFITATFVLVDWYGAQAWVPPSQSQAQFTECLEDENRPSVGMVLNRMSGECQKAYVASASSAQERGNAGLIWQRVKGNQKWS